MKHQPSRKVAASFDGDAQGSALRLTQASTAQPPRIGTRTNRSSSANRFGAEAIMRNTFRNHFTQAFRQTMLHSVRLVVLAVVASLALGSVAWGGDDDYRHNEVQQRAHQNGYQDGVRHGNYDRGQGFRYNVHSQQYNDARDGYERWMGSFGHYKRVYRAGYEDGYRRGFDSAGFRRDRDRDGDRDSWR
jgi:hypothetical protein